ncbi:MAG TPA: DUF2071 domain-containing protein, partial [Gemmatimonadales bacterium]|nr:DUF2071 domain-containing protein [Gemmatimonadales bacterium]
GDEVRHGVVSIKELVPRPFVGGMARLLYREPYIVVPMRSKVRAAPAPVVEYQWNDVGRWCTIAAAADGEGKELAPGSLDEFITERHWGYNGEGRETLEYRVDHSPWHIWRVHSTRVDYEPVPLCGRELAGQLTTPISAILADGSAITVHWRNAIAA